MTHLVVHSDEVFLVHPADDVISSKRGTYDLCCKSLLLSNLLLITLLFTFTFTYLLQCDITFSLATVLAVITSLHCQRNPGALLGPLIFTTYF